MTAYFPVPPHLFVSRSNAVPSNEQLDMKMFWKIGMINSFTRLSPPTSGQTLESFLSKTTSRHFTNIFTFAPEVTFLKDFFFQFNILLFIS